MLINEYLNEIGVRYNKLESFGNVSIRHRGCSKASVNDGRELFIIPQHRHYNCHKCNETGSIKELLSKYFGDDTTQIIKPRLTEEEKDTLDESRIKNTDSSDRGESEKSETDTSPTNTVKLAKVNAQNTLDNIGETLSENEIKRRHDHLIHLQQKYPEMSIVELERIINQTVLYDCANKVIVFLGYLTAYTEQDQLNIYLSGPSASGKTYMAKEVAKYYPKDDKEEISGASPKAFFYRKPEVDEKTGMRYIPAERKIYMFLEVPHFQLMENLRGFLSHDSKNSRFLRTNKDNKSKNVAEEVYLRGFSATIFCTTSMDMDEQEATRALLLSPEVSREKLKASVELASRRNADPEKFDREVEADPERKNLKRRIIEIRNLHINSVILPDHTSILSAFNGITRGIKPRHTRDIVHLQSLVKAVALLNAWHRLDDEDNVVANDKDIQQAVKLWQGISISQELGIPPYAYNFWQSFIIPTFKDKNADKSNVSQFTGVTRQEIVNKHYELTGELPNEDNLRKRLYPALIAASLIRQEDNPYNKKELLIYPIYPNETKSNTVEPARG
jgi:hypothetical protein